MATAGVGTKFYREDDGSSSTFTAIAEINSISGPTMSRGTIDTTSLDTTGGYRTFIGGFRDAGEITLEMNFTLAGYLLLKSDFESALQKAYQIVLPDTNETTFDFNGFVTALPLNISPDDKITASCTIKISGTVTVSS